MASGGIGAPGSSEPVVTTAPAGDLPEGALAAAASAAKSSAESLGKSLGPVRESSAMALVTPGPNRCSVGEISLTYLAVQDSGPVGADFLSHLAYLALARVRRKRCFAGTYLTASEFTTGLWAAARLRRGKRCLQPPPIG